MTFMRALVVVSVISLVSCFYEDGSSVQVLTNDNFKSLVRDSQDIWLIEFYAPWCGHCKKLTPEFEKAAKALEGIVRLGAVDMTTDGEAGQDFEIAGYPTLKFFSLDKEAPVTFEGDRKKAAIIEYCLDRARELALSRLGVKAQAAPGALDESNVVVLSDSSFDGLVFNSPLPWMIEFYAPWCKHCKKLTPEWAKLATKLKGEFNIAKIDATVETQLAERFKVEGFPSIKFFEANAHPDDKAEEYGGERQYADLYAFARKKMAVKTTTTEKNNVVVGLEQLSDQAVYNQKCSKATCILTFVPPLAYSSHDERQQFLQIIKDTQSEAKQPKFNYLWVTGGEFEEFEAELNILGSSYPVTVAINDSKKEYYNHKGGFTKESLKQFVNKVASGQEEGFDYTELPTLKSNNKRNDL